MADSRNFIVYDIETRNTTDEVGGWNHVFEMGIATCVTYSYNENLYRFWDHTEKDHRKLLDYMNGCIAVGFNTINFDSKVLLGNNRKLLPNGSTAGNPFGESKQYGWKNFDIFAEIWRTIFKTNNIVDALRQQGEAKQFHVSGLFTLDSLAQNTLGGYCMKTTNGKTAPAKFKMGMLKELWEYNLQDVRTEKELFEFIRKYKYIINGQFDMVYIGRE
jgi:hypothetical protein